MKTALITGITGQDGAYLAEFLLGKGYTVHGVKRRSSSYNTGRIDRFYKDPHEKDVKMFLHYGDLTDSTNIIRLVQETQPDEIYNLAAQSHVKVSFETPEYTANADALADACLFLMGSYDKSEIINIGTGEDVTVKELAETVKEEVGYAGEIRFDKTKPDGTPRKLLDVSRINSLGWKAKTPLKAGIEKTYEWYKSQYF